MKCLESKEEKSEGSQAVKLKLKLICFTFLVGSLWILTFQELTCNMFIWPSKESIATHVRSTELELDSVRP